MSWAPLRGANFITWEGNARPTLFLKGENSSWRVLKSAQTVEIYFFALKMKVGSSGGLPTDLSPTGNDKSTWPVPSKVASVPASLLLRKLADTLARVLPHRLARLCNNVSTAVSTLEITPVG